MSILPPRKHTLVVRFVGHRRVVPKRTAGPATPRTNVCRVAGGGRGTVVQHSPRRRPYSGAMGRTRSASILSGKKSLIGRLRVESHFVRRTVFQHYPSAEDSRTRDVKDDGNFLSISRRQSGVRLFDLKAAGTCGLEPIGSRSVRNCYPCLRYVSLPRHPG